MNLNHLPTHCDYWPCLPGDDPADVPIPTIGMNDRGEQCCDKRNDFFCTLAPGHAYPHIADGIVKVCAVWDDVWYADDHGGSFPIQEVPVA